MSNLSEEEKKAIDFYNGKEFSFTLDIPEDKMQELKKALGITDNEEDSFESHQIRIQTLLNLIDRLQKENEYLREREEYLEKRRSDIINTFQNKVTGTTIPKDKIREKMEFLDKNIELQWASTSYNEIDVEKYQYALEMLEELLKEN